jgi:hypothetical protein
LPLQIVSPGRFLWNVARKARHQDNR